MMAKIPQYETQISPRPIQTEKVSANEMNSAVVGGTQQLQALSEIDRKFQELNTLKEQTQASIKLSEQSQLLYTQSLQDPDTSDENRAKYRSQLEEISEKQLGAISNGVAREKIRSDFQIKNFNTYNKITNGFRERQIQDQVYSFVKDQYMKKQEFVQEADPKVRQLLINQARQSVDENGLILSPEKKMAAIKDLDTWDDEWRTYNIEQSMIENPYDARELLASGYFGDMPPKEKREWNTKIDTAIKNKIELQKREEEFIQKENQKKISIDMVSDPTSYSDTELKSKALLGEITNSFRDESIAFKQKIYAETSDYGVIEEIDNRMVGASVKEDGEMYTDNEIASYIMKNSEKLSESDAKREIDRIKKDRKTRTNEAIKIEGQGLKAYLDGTIGKTYSIETLTGEAKGKIEQQMYEFNKKVSELKNPSVEEIEKIANDFKYKETKEKDPNFKPNEKTDYNKLKIIPSGTEATNPVTGETVRMIDDGRWVIIEGAYNAESNK